MLKSCNVLNVSITKTIGNLFLRPMRVYGQERK